MGRTLKSDRVLFLAVLALVCVSAVMVCSASAAAALQKNWDVTRFLFKQLTWVAVGFLLLGVAMRINYRSYRQPFVIWSAVAMVVAALALVLIIAPEINGSRRWFGVGGIGVQPSEFAKVAVVLFIADLVARRMARVNEPSAVILPVGIVLGVVVGLMLAQPDLGTPAFLALVSVMMLFSAGLGYGYIVGVAGVAVPVLAALVTLSHRSAELTERFLAWWNPWLDPLGGGFQIIQSFIAVGSGGLLGRGFMQGQQKIGFLPEPQTDFIFAVIAEEFGLVGATIVLALFVVIAWRGYRVAMSMPDEYGGFLAVGLTALLFVQALFNMSVVLGILPNKGLPLPFVSAGGSSMLVSMLAMGILLNLSQHTGPRVRMTA
jgi:cell division protein FtsW